MTTQKNNKCENCRKCLPKGKLNGWKYIHCYECPAAEYVDSQGQYWCHEHNGWSDRGEGCISSPIS